MINHASDCSLHNGPAYMPEPCNCGVEPGRTPAAYGSEFPMTANRAWLNLGGTISSLTGYLSVLEAEEVVTKDYIGRLKNHYIPKLIEERERFNALYHPITKSTGGKS